MKFRGKLIISIVILVVGSIFIVGGASYKIMSGLTMENSMQSMETSSNLIAEDLVSSFENYMQEAEVSGKDPILTSDANNVVKSDRIKELTEMYGFTSGNLLDANGVSIVDGTDFSDRDYVQAALAGNTLVSNVTLSKLTGKYGVSIASPLYDAFGNVNGVVYYRMDIDFILNILEAVKISNNSVAYVIDEDGNIVVHPDQDKILVDETNLNTTGRKALLKACNKGESGSILFGKGNDQVICGYSPIENGWSIIVEAPFSDFAAAILEKYIKTVFLDILIIVLACIAASIIASTFSKTLKVCLSNVKALGKGDLSTEIPEAKGKDEFVQLQNAVKEMQENFKNMIGEANEILSGMASYDLAQNDMSEYPGEYNTLAESVNQIKMILTRLIVEVQGSASGVNVGSGEIASATDLLSRGTITQASSIQQVVDDVNNVNDIINTNLENALVVEEQIKHLEREIQTGNAEMTELRNVVKNVEEMSSDIQKIVGTIDNIAFQTNILALNASVEAARAGEMGKGFAVVADEVGALAQKASEASKQTSELISSCLAGIESALQYAETTAGSLQQIVKNSSEISVAFETITEDTKEQAAKASNIKREINNISEVVQTNTATAEETAAATQELNEQARNLGSLIAKFHV